MTDERDQASENPYEPPGQVRGRGWRRTLPWWLEPPWSFFLLLFILGVITMVVEVFWVLTR